MINLNDNKNVVLFLESETVKQVAKYLIVGGVCTVLDFALLFFLTNYLDIKYLTSSVISFITGTILNYFLCTSWIFRVRIIKNRTHEFIYYLIITGVGLSVNTLMIWSLTEIFSLYFMISKLFATMVTFWWNFAARKYFLHSI